MMRAWFMKHVEYNLFPVSSVIGWQMLRSGGRTELTKLKTIFLVKKYLNEHIIYYNFSFFIEKSI